MRYNHGTVIALSVATVFALAACGPTPGPVATPSASPTSAETPTAEPSAAATTHVVIAARTLDVFTGDELIHSWSYDTGDPESVTVPALTGVFGSSPIVTSDVAQCEGSTCEYATASWDGFTLGWFTGLPNYPWGMNVKTTVAQVGEVEIVSVDGSTVGDDLIALITAAPEYYAELTRPEGITHRVGVGAVDPLQAGQPFPEFAIFVSLDGVAPFNTVTLIVAPQQNFGI